VSGRVEVEAERARSSVSISANSTPSRPRSGPARISPALVIWVEQSVDIIDRGVGGFRVSEQRINRRRGKSISEPASRSGLGRLGVVLWHVGVLPDRHVDHNGRSWSTRGLHTCRDTPGAWRSEARSVDRASHPTDQEPATHVTVGTVEHRPVATPSTSVEPPRLTHSPHATLCRKDHDQRPPRVPTVETADQPARAAADRLRRQPAPARRPTTQPQPDPRRRGVHRRAPADPHRHRGADPWAALGRPPSPRPAASPADVPAAPGGVRQPPTYAACSPTFSAHTRSPPV